MEEIYNDGLYANLHKDWHEADASLKAAEVERYFSFLKGSDSIKIADVGGGTGAVAENLRKFLNRSEIDFQVFDISASAIAYGKEKFRSLKFFNKHIQPGDGPFDCLMLIDVLEHLENPWQFLQTCGAISKHIIVRQPLLNNFSNFRTNNYKHQREYWGHINYFNIHSFIDLMRATGFSPISYDLLAPWELKTGESKKKIPLWKTVLHKQKPFLSSVIFSGYYCNGIFKNVRNA